MAYVRINYTEVTETETGWINRKLTREQAYECAAHGGVVKVEGGGGWALAYSECDVRRCIAKAINGWRPAAAY